MLESGEAALLMPSAKQASWRLTRDLQPKLISHFLAVADNHTISRAAEVLNLTQPALSKSIKQLEDRLGVPLFERWPTGVRLTAYGEILARRSRLIDRELSYAVTELQTLKGGSTGIVRIGAGLVWSQKFLPPIIARFQELHRGIQIELRTGVIDTLVPLLAAGDLDLICTTLDFPDSNDFAKEPLVEIRQSIFARRGHPLSDGREIVPSDLAEYGWIALKNDYVGHNRLSSFFAASSLPPPQVRIELFADAALLALVGTTDYLCNMPTELADIARANGLAPLNVIGTELWRSNAGVAYRRTGYPPPAVRYFLGMLREAFPGHG